MNFEIFDHFSLTNYIKILLLVYLKAYEFSTFKFNFQGRQFFSNNHSYLNCNKVLRIEKYSSITI